MPNLNLSQKKTADLSLPSEIITTFITPASGKIGTYTTKLDPVILATPGFAGDKGKDIKVIDKDGTIAPTWVDSYATAINKVDVYTKNQLSLTRPTMLLVIAQGGGDLDVNNNPMSVESKIVTTDLASGVIQSIVPRMSVDYVVKGTSAYCAAIFTWDCVYPNPGYVGTYKFNYAISSHIIKDQNGNLHFAFNKQNPTTLFNEIFHAWSSNGGQSWSTEYISQISSVSQSCPQLVIDINNTLHFIWSEARFNSSNPGCGSGNWYLYDIKYRNKNINTGEFSAVELLSRNDTAYTGWQLFPSIQIKNDGLSVGVAWYGFVCASQIGSLKVSMLYRERSASGTWYGTETIEYNIIVSSGIVLWDSSISIDYDSYDSPHVAYCHYSGSDGETFYARHAYKSGGSWTTENIYPYAHAYMMGLSHIVIDLEDKLHILVALVHANEGLRSDLYYYNKPSGESWSLGTLLDNDTWRGSIGLQLDNAGNIYSYYAKILDPTIQYFYSGKVNKYSPSLNLVSSEIFSAAGLYSYVSDKRDIVCMSTPWSRLPKIDNVYQHLSQNHNCIVFAISDHADWSSGDLLFTADPSSVLGSPSGIIKYESYSSRIRGVISKSKLNGCLVSPSIIS
jgi:hypothetical protein